MYCDCHIIMPASQYNMYSNVYHCSKNLATKLTYLCMLACNFNTCTYMYIQS